MIFSSRRKAPGGGRGMITMKKWAAIRQLKEQGFGKKTLHKSKK